MGRLGSSTPQPLRSAPIEDRFSYESEQWDDLANVVFVSQVDPGNTFSDGVSKTGVTDPNLLCYLEVPCPVPSRLEIHFSVQIQTGAGGVDVTFGPVANIVVPAAFDPRLVKTVNAGDNYHLSSSRAWDFPAGLAIVANYIVIPIAHANVTLLTNHLIIRRGRQP